MAHENWKCIECDNLNRQTDDKCICGNLRPMNVSTSGSHKHGCLINRCPMPGVHSDSLRGGDRWYCRFHFYYKGDIQHCARITQELMDNRPKISGVKPNGDLVNYELPVNRAVRLAKEKEEKLVNEFLAAHTEALEMNYE